MCDAYSRMEILLGQDGVDRLSSAKIAVFGLGGVGSYAVEALARCGVGSLTLVDPDAVSADSMNRQLLALKSTIGHKKVQIAKDRIRDIDEDILVHTYETFYSKDTAGMIDLRTFDYIVDAMDTVPSKIFLIEEANRLRVPVISCMETTNKLNPARFEIGDISKVAGDPVARELRAELRKNGVRRVKVLYSRERAKRSGSKAQNKNTNTQEQRGSISFVPSVAGLLIAGEVVRDLLTAKKQK